MTLLHKIYLFSLIIPLIKLQTPSSPKYDLKSLIDLPAHTNL